MKIQYKFFVFLCLVLFTGKAFASPIPEENREFLFQNLKLQPLKTEVYFDFESIDLNSGFAIYAEFETTKNRPYLIINESRKVTRPIQRGSGLVFPIINEDLLENKQNSITFITETGEAINITAIQVFKLHGLIEEVHLPQYLGDSEKVAPALHPSQNDYDVQKYTLDMEIATDSRFLDGTVSIDILSLVDGLETIAFDFADADFSGQSLTITGVFLETNFDLQSFTTIDRTNDWIIFNLPQAQRPDSGETIRIQISYNGEPGFGQGAFGLETYNRDIRSNSKSIIYSFSEPYGARTWWPCKDVTNDKALLDFIITTDNSSQAVSNGELVSATALLNNRTRYYWSHQYPIPPYLIAFCVSDYEYFGGTYTSQDGMKQMPVGHYIFSESTDDPNAFQDTIVVTDFFSELFGEYPYIEEKYVTMTWGGGFGMEHSTATSTNLNDLRSSNGSGFSRRNVHELAHQWFGNMVTPVNFDHLWLNEGWATYCEALERENRFGIASYFSYIEGFENSTITNNVPIVNPDADAFRTSLVYRKAALVLHMLRHVMGDDNFFQATRNYLANNAYGVVDTEIFETEMEAVHGDDLDWFFDQWIYDDGAPEYEWSWSQVDSNLQVIISQTRTPFFRMPVDVFVEYLDGTDETFVVENTQNGQAFQIPITKQVVDVSFDPDGWIYNLGVTEVQGPTVLQPVLETVIGTNNSALQVELSWNHPDSSSIDGFILEHSTNGTAWSQIVDESVLDANTTSHQVQPTGTENIYRLRAISSGFLSDPTDPYAVTLSLTNTNAKVLIVDGYDREQAWSVPNQPFTKLHGQTLFELDIPFDTCANESVENLMIDISDYDLVIWQSSEQSTIDNPFQQSEIDQVESYLQNGGQLFVSGAEIGWAHGRGASEDFDANFYNNYLKATYVADDSDSYTVNGLISTIFDGLSIDNDSIGDTTYLARFPDVIVPASGGTGLMTYDNGLGAAVLFEGIFPDGVQSGRLIYLGFSFETIIDQTDRVELMRRALEFFEIEANENIPTTDQFIIF